MTTKTIGIKEFRENITSLWKEASKKNIKFIVMYHSKPILEVTPVKEKDLYEKLKNDIAEAREQVKRGETYTLEEVEKILGIT